jgi:hypothetical protein
VRRAGLAVLALLVAAAGVGATSSAFSDQTASTGSFASDSDWTAPATSAATVRKTEGGVGGYVRPGATYHVHAATVDRGNPPSGIASATANLTALSAGAGSTVLGEGTTTFGGVSYTRRTAAGSPLTVGAGVAPGPYTFSTTVTDAEGHVTTSTGHGVTVDATRPDGTDVGSSNGAGGTPGRLEAGDSIAMRYGEGIDPASLDGAWTGSPALSVLAMIVNDDAAAGGRDSLRVCPSSATATPCATIGLGTVDLGSSAWVTATTRFPSSTLSATAARDRFTLTFAAAATPATVSATPIVNTNMSFKPEAKAFDFAGNLSLTGGWTESAGDTDF